MSNGNRTHKQTNKKSPMAYFLCFLILSSLNAVLCQQRYSNISLNSSLKPTTGSWWLSPSGIYAFGFYQQNNGYAVGIFLDNITEKTVVWTANRDNPTVSSNVTLMLTSDGRFILQQREGQDIYVARPSQPIESASMLDSGNFVLYNSSMSIIWQSFDYPTNTLLPGQRLLAGGELFSSASATDYSRGIFRLKMQGDGNLVQYPVETPDTSPYAYYASGTDGAGNNVSLNLDTDGRLYLLNGSSFLNNITIGGYPTTRTINLMRIDLDGIFRVYSYSLDPNGNSTVRWSSTDDKCAPKGLCGLNAYCIQMDEVADCICLPGFDFVQSGNWSAGCTRKIISEGCKSENDSISFDIQTLDNTVWEDDPYALLELNTEEDCKQACHSDCNCEVALFKEGKCRKQRLPLRYGRRLLTDSNVALVKVSTPAPVDKQGKEVKKVHHLDILIISISLLVVAAIILAFSWIYVQRKHVGAYKKISEGGEVKLIEEVSLRAFTYGELVQATNDFKEELGKGASGTVYRGILEKNKKVVAVKRLEKEFEDGDREFQTEMKVIGKTYHRNLVRLLGYCIDQNKRLLVYEYMSNGSLADQLFKNDQKITSWEERMKIARHIARGILYLHEECETQIIHCDIKPQNILLDQQGCAKLADFGLAKLLKQNQTNTYTGIRGTKGYVAPEWHQKQPITVKADVYSFGIVLLEIVCCRKSVDWSLPEDEAILDEWVYNCYEAGEIGKLVENQLFIDKTKVERMVKIGIWCIQEEPSLRPSMNKVVLMLEGTVQIPVPPNPTSFLSTSI